MKITIPSSECDCGESDLITGGQLKCYISNSAYKDRYQVTNSSEILPWITSPANYIFHWNIKDTDSFPILDTLNS